MSAEHSHRQEPLTLLSALRLFPLLSVSPTPGNNPRIQASNLSRECIRHFFPKRKCFVFDRPTSDKGLLQKIETVSEDQMDPKFLEQTRAFVSYIFTYAKIKTLREGIKVTGNRECFILFLKIPLYRVVYGEFISMCIFLKIIYTMIIYLYPYSEKNLCFILKCRLQVLL